MTDHASTPPATVFPNWKRCWAITLIGLTMIYCCRSVIRKFGMPLHHEVFASIAMSVMALSVVLVVNWHLTRRDARPTTPGYWPDRPFQAGMLVFLMFGFNPLDVLVDKAADKALWNSVSVLQFAFTCFAGWLTYRLLIPVHERDVARNAEAGHRS